MCSSLQFACSTALRSARKHLAPCAARCSSHVRLLCGQHVNTSHHVQLVAVRMFDCSAVNLRGYLVDFWKWMEDYHIILRSLEAVKGDAELLLHPDRLVGVGEPLLLYPAHIEHVACPEVHLVRNVHRRAERLPRIIDGRGLHLKGLGGNQGYLCSEHGEAVEQRVHSTRVLQVAN